MAEQDEPRAEEAELMMTFAEFLASVPPGTEKRVSDLSSGRREGSYTTNTPDLELFCSTETCDGLRTFAIEDTDLSMRTERLELGFLRYHCRNCQSCVKIFSLYARRDAGNRSGIVFKFGEEPPFGPPVPARVITLIGPDRDLFLRERRCENQGLGIGAFAYYRRVVENQKGRIIREMGRVAGRLGAEPAVVALFETAAAETQFSTAIDRVKAAIPSVLLSEGKYNPLTLLHSALSEGLHDLTDEENLEVAQEIRIVLTDLADRMTQALKDEAELQQAVSRLLNRKKARSETK
jgi:hypothetical protein